MTKSRKPEKVCDICGYGGDGDSIATCYHCKKSSEHLYCMQTLLYSIPRRWFCEECRSRDDVLSLEYDITECCSKGPMSGMIPNDAPSSLAAGRLDPKTAKTDGKYKFPVKRKCSDTKDDNQLSGTQKMLCKGVGSFKSPDLDETQGVPVPSSPCRKHVTSLSKCYNEVKSAKVKCLPLEEIHPRNFGGLAKRGNLSSSLSPTKMKNPLLSQLRKNSAGYPNVSTVASSKSCLQKGISNFSCTPPHLLPKPTSERLTSIKEEEKTLMSPCHATVTSMKDVPVGVMPTIKYSPSSCKVSPAPHVESGSEILCPSKHKTPVLNIIGEKHLWYSPTSDGKLRIDKAPGEKAPAEPKKEHPCNEDLVEFRISTNEMRHTFCADVQERVQPLMLLKFPEENLLNPPIQDAIWKGSFETTTSVGSRSIFYDEILGHIPSEKVSDKVKTFSKKMPKNMQFKLLPRCDVFPKLFKMGSPTEHDIALYYFPGDLDRSIQKYRCLLEMIERDDLVMQSWLDDVELLIFTSKQLPMDSQRSNMQTYLWGVFHHVKHKKPTDNLQGLCSPHVPARLVVPPGFAPVKFGGIKRTETSNSDAPLGFSKPCDTRNGGSFGVCDGGPISRLLVETTKNATSSSEKLECNSSLKSSVPVSATKQNQYSTGVDDPGDSPKFFGAQNCKITNTKQAKDGEEHSEVDQEKQGLLGNESCSDTLPETPSSSHLESVSTIALQFFPVETKTIKVDSITDQGLGTGLCTNREAPLLTLSRPQYVKDGDKWIPTISKERLQQDDGCEVEELKLTL